MLEGERPVSKSWQTQQELFCECAPLARVLRLKGINHNEFKQPGQATEQPTRGNLQCIECLQGGCLYLC